MNNIEKNINDEQEILDDLMIKIDDSNDKCKKEIESCKASIEKSKNGDADVIFDVQKYNQDIDKQNTKIKQYKKYIENNQPPYEAHIELLYENEYEKYLYGNELIEDFGDKKLVWSNNENVLFKKIREAILKNEKTFEYNGKYVLQIFKTVTISNGKIKAVEVTLDEDGIISSNVDKNLIELKRNNLISISLYNTISLEQLKIITNTFAGNVLIQGCAGSGKSVVLLHRLANRIFETDKNNKSIKSVEVQKNEINNTKIITSSKEMIIMYSNLAKLLKLNEIKQLTIEEYYEDLLLKYLSELKFKTKIVDESKLNVKILDYFYKNSKSEIFDEIKNEIDISQIYKKYGLKCGKNDIKKINIALSTMIYDKMLDNNYEDRKIIDELVDEVLEYIKKMQIKIINNKRNLYKIKTYIEAIVKNDTKKNTTYAQSSKNTQLIESINKIRDFETQIIADYISEKGNKDKYVLEISFNSNNIISSENKIENSKIIDILKNYSIEKVLENKEYLLNEFVNKKEIKECIKNLNSDNNINLKDEICKIISKVFKRNKKYNENTIYYNELIFDFLKTKYNMIFEYYLENYIQNVYEKFDIPYEKHLYRYRLYLALYLAYMYYGSLNIGENINIDEVQDYSIDELSLLKNVIGKKGYFEIYGDVDQTLQEYRSITDWNEISNDFIDKSNRYKLSYNYRNTNQIIDFINLKTHKSIKGIGLSGDEVEEFGDISEALYKFYEAYLGYDRIEDKSNVSFAIIVSQNVDGSVVLNNIKKYCELDDLSDFSAFNEIEFEKISVIDVNKAKGLEFTGVLVINSDFKNNELYVSISRALKILYYYEGKAFESIE